MWWPGAWPVSSMHRPPPATNTASGSSHAPVRPPSGLKLVDAVPAIQGPGAGTADGLPGYDQAVNSPKRELRVFATDEAPPSTSGSITYPT